MNRIIRWLGVMAVLVGFGAVQAETITVSAAISLKESLVEIGRQYEAETGEKVEFNFGASGQLMAQIRQGAPVDLFISAARNQVEDLDKAGLLAKAPVKVVAGNRLVLVVPADAKDGPRGFSELAAGGVKRIALGQPKTVPAGEYAMQTLESLRIVREVRDRLIFGSNVRQVLDYVARGEVDAGIVYATDAMKAGGRVRVVATAETGTHKAIEYPAAIINASTKPATSQRFLDYIGGDKGQAILAKHGFVTMPNGPTTRPSP